VYKRAIELSDSLPSLITGVYFFHFIHSLFTKTDYLRKMARMRTYSYGFALNYFKWTVVLHTR